MKTKFRRIFLGIIFILVLGLSLLLILGFLTQVPYSGLLLEKNGKTVVKVYDQSQLQVFQPGDELVSIHGVQVNEFADSLSVQFWEGLAPGDEVLITLIRDEELVERFWTFTGRTSEEFTDRLLSPIWLAIFFWGCGASAYLTIRPTDSKWTIFLALTFLLALWFVSFFGPASQHLWFTAYLERISAWLILPLLISSHLLFPNWLFNKLEKSNILLLVLGYCAAAVLLIFDLLNPSWHIYAYGLLTSMILGTGIHLIRYILDRPEGQQLKYLYRTAIFSYLTTSLLIYLWVFGIPTLSWLMIIFIAGIMLFPLVLFYTIWSGKAQNYQFQTNRYLALTLYSMLVILVLMILLIILENLQQPLNTSISILLAVVTATITTQSYPYFEKLVDKVIFRIPISTQELLQSFSKQLDRTKDTASISSLMGDMILPTLLVRQSALIEIQSHTRIRTLDLYGVIPDQIPKSYQLQQLLELELRVIPPQTMRSFPKELHWIRVILPLIFDDQIIGVWLLGQRDPNNLYSNHVVDLLQALAQQTTIALINHQKSQRLAYLYKANIDRNEEERARLARNLHDDTLNDLALLQRGTSDPFLSDGITKVITSLRKTINGLRPEMLSYGLVTALYDLGDALRERQNKTRVIVQIDGAPIPIAPNVEQHLYRIVQQACENALRHSQADLIRIIGIITEKAIHLTVVDNGIGFDSESMLDFSELISNQHFGLAGMHERAGLINASLNIQSSHGQGTRISIFWKNPNFQ